VQGDDALPDRLADPTLVMAMAAGDAAVTRTNKRLAEARCMRARDALVYDADWDEDTRFAQGDAAQGA
jgi:hypothetical protein